MIRVYLVVKYLTIGHLSWTSIIERSTNLSFHIVICEIRSKLGIVTETILAYSRRRWLCARAEGRQRWIRRANLLGGGFGGGFGGSCSVFRAESLTAPALDSGGGAR